MALDPTSLRYRIFGPTPAANLSPLATPPRALTIADKFKAEIVREIPECSSPKRKRLLDTPYSSPPPPRKRALLTSAQPRVVELGARLKDTYADRCQELHRASEAQLEAAREVARQALLGRLEQVRGQVRGVVAGARLRPLGQSRLKIGSEEAVPVSRYVEEFRGRMEGWAPRIEALMREVGEARDEVRRAGEEVLGLYRDGDAAVERAMESVGRAKEECFAEMGRVRAEAEEELRGKEKGFDDQVRKIQAFVAKLLKDDWTEEEGKEDDDYDDEGGAGDGEGQKVEESEYDDDDEYVQED